MASVREVRVNLLIATGHFLSHFYMLCLPPLFVAWHARFNASYPALGLAVALLSAVTAALQTPVGLLAERYGARRFLIAGAGLMTVSIALMGAAGAFWQILILAVLCGIGNSVIHPCDYTILAASISQNRIGRAFSLHTFAGNLGFAAGPPVTIGLASLLGWRGALAVVGVVGLPLVASILWQTKILLDRRELPHHHEEARLSGRELLLTPAMFLFLLFYALTSMATSGVQAWLITVLHVVGGISVALASSALTLYLIGVSAGVLLGGSLSDRTTHHLRLVAVLTIPAALLFLAVALLKLPMIMDFLCLLAAGIFFGTSRTPRDMMARKAARPGQVGTVFAFVTTGLPLGAALTPVPFGFLIGAGRPALVLILVAALMGATILVAVLAHAAARCEPAVKPQSQSSRAGSWRPTPSQEVREGRSNHRSS